MLGDCPSDPAQIGFFVKSVFQLDIFKKRVQQNESRTLHSETACKLVEVILEFLEILVRDWLLDLEEQALSHLHVVAGDIKCFSVR